MEENYKLSHLRELEAESIHIIREVAAEFENPVMLYSIGKDSSVMVRLAEKAFYPGKVPFPLMHIDSKWKFREMIEFRDQYAKEHGWNLIVESNMEAFNAGVGPFTHGSKVHTDLMKTQALLHGLDKYRFDAAFGGARRDEEKSRAKERIFSFRDRFHQWDPKNQRPELWDIYNAKIHKGESIRVFPLSNWTELDIWQYIRLENIPIVPLYFAKERPVVNIDGNLIMADDDRLPEEYRDRIEMKKVRFRTLGCWPLTGAVESDADTIEKIVDDKTYIGCMVYGKTKIPDPGTGKEVPVPRNQWKVMENHHEPIVSKEVFEKAQSLQIRYTKKSKFDRETTLLGGYVKCGNCCRSLTSSSPIHSHILYSCAYSKGKEDTGCFAGKADNKMLEHIVLAEIKAYLRQNISQEQMQQSMRKQHEDSIEAYKTESADCEKCQEQIKIQNRQNYEKYHEGQMNQNQFMEAKKQLEEERERLQKRVQELDELINDEKEILMKKNVPVEQMLKYLGYENLTREMLEEYVQGIYVYDDGRVGVEYK